MVEKTIKHIVIVFIIIFASGIFTHFVGKGEELSNIDYMTTYLLLWIVMFHIFKFICLDTEDNKEDEKNVK